MLLRQLNCHEGRVRKGERGLLTTSLITACRVLRGSWDTESIMTNGYEWIRMDMNRQRGVGGHDSEASRNPTHAAPSNR